MKGKYLVAGLVAVLAAVTGVLVYQGSRPTQAADSDVITVTTRVTVTSGTGTSGTGNSGTGTPGSGTPGTTTTPERSTSPTTAGSTTPSATSTTGSDGRPASNIPMRKLKPGEKAPQFVIFSFDGAGSHTKWNEFMDAAAPTNSRFVGFLSGIYLLETQNKAAYTGPGHSPGKASIGFGGTAEEVLTEVGDLNLAYSRGHEIGTHYNGHFCDGANPSGKDWSTAAWKSELDQFFHFVGNWQQINGLTSAPKLNVPADSIKGGRTPCLEGEWEEMVPAWKAHGMTYDSSIPAPYSGIAWPEHKDGIWEFYMPTVYSPGFKGMVMAMDYNFWYKFNQAKDQPETAPQLRAIVASTYQHMYESAYNGNRAPILIANHFNNWNGDSFNQPALAFMKDTCGKPDTYCATYSDVIAWMELQDPAVLKALLDQAPVAGSASG